MAGHKLQHLQVMKKKFVWTKENVLGKDQTRE